MRAVVFSAAVLALSQASMSLASTLPLRVTTVFSRQSPPQLPDPSQIPPSCQPSCVPPITTLQTCINPPEPGCLCSVDLVTGYYNCTICLGELVKTIDYMTPQQTVDGIENACAMVGIPLPKLTFPGQDPNRPLSSVVSSASGTGTGTLSIGSIPGISNATTSGGASGSGSSSSTAAASQTSGGSGSSSNASQTSGGGLITQGPLSPTGQAQTVPNSLPPPTGTTAGAGSSQTAGNAAARLRGEVGMAAVVCFVGVALVNMAI